MRNLMCSLALVVLVCGFVLPSNGYSWHRGYGYGHYYYPAYTYSSYYYYGYPMYDHAKTGGQSGLAASTKRSSEEGIVVDAGDTHRAAKASKANLKTSH